MPYFWKTKILLARLETTYGNDPAPAAVGGMLARDVALVPMDGGEEVRDLETGFMGNQGSLPSGLMMKLSYKVELVGSGTKGVAPEWRRPLMALGCSETIVALTSVTYGPLSPGATVLPSITHYLWIGDTLYKLIGGRGTGKLAYSAQGIPYLDVEFTSLFAVPAESARILPNNNTFLTPELVTAGKTTLTVNAVALKFREATFDIGNTIDGRFLAGTGGDSIEIIDRDERFNVTVEATPLTTINPFLLAQAATRVPVILTHGTADGRRTILNMPTAQMMRMKGLTDDKGIKAWPLEIQPISTLAGNDQWTLAVT